MVCILLSGNPVFNRRTRKRGNNHRSTRMARGARNRAWLLFVWTVLDASRLWHGHNIRHLQLYMCHIDRICFGTGSVVCCLGGSGALSFVRRQHYRAQYSLPSYRLACRYPLSGIWVRGSCCSSQTVSCCRAPLRELCTRRRYRACRDGYSLHGVIYERYHDRRQANISECIVSIRRAAVVRHIRYCLASIHAHVMAKRYVGVCACYG